MSLSTQTFDAAVANSDTPKKTFNELLSQQPIKVDMGDYFEIFTSRFYPDQDLSFMNYFLELCSEENEGQFIVPHGKLIEYGVMTSARSNDVGSKLGSLGLSENEDFELRDVSQLRTQGGTSTKNIYLLTPDAFKLCLMRAQRRRAQPIDPVVYSMYYLILEKVQCYYMRYEAMFKDKMINDKDSNIAALRGDINELKDMNRELLGFAKDQKKDLSKANTKLDVVQTKLDDLSDDLAEAREVAESVVDFLEDKSYISTKNPSKESLHHYVASTTYISNTSGDRFATIISGQRCYVDSKITELTTTGDQYHRVHQLLIEPFYNANGIDLRGNAQEEFKDRRRAAVADYHKKMVAHTKQQNQIKKKAITQWNLAHPSEQRTFEPTVWKKVGVKDVPIKFNKTFVQYAPTPVMSFKSVIQIIYDVNNITQQSPVRLDDMSVYVPLV